MKKRILLLDVLPVMSGIGIRTAVLADQPALFAIHETLFRDDISRIWGWDDRSQLENFHKEWNEVETLVIHHDGQLAGYIQKAIYPDHFYVLNLAVVPAYQSRGIGAHALAMLREEAMAQGKELRLSVFKINPRALSFYLRHGFVVNEVTETSTKLRWPGHP